MTLISVILPNYNYGNYLKGALDSILNHNSSTAFEIIVVDDGSTDHSREILQNYASDPRLRIFLQERNQGVAAAVNFGMEQSKGKFLNFFASDDLHLPGTLDTVSSLIEALPSTSLFSSDYATFTDPEQIRCECLLPLDTFRIFTPAQVKQLFRHTRFWLPGHTLFIRKSQCSPYDQRLGPICDWLIHHSIALEAGVCYIPRPLMAMRQHPLAFSQSQTFTAKRHMWLYLLKTLNQNPQKYHSLVQSGILRMLGLKAIAWELLKTPSYWKYLFPIAKKILERRLLKLCRIDPERYWTKRVVKEN